jgi:hypothetical protein
MFHRQSMYHLVQHVQQARSATSAHPAAARGAGLPEEFGILLRLCIVVGLGVAFVTLIMSAVV